MMFHEPARAARVALLLFQQIKGAMMKLTDTEGGAFQPNFEVGPVKWAKGIRAGLTIFNFYSISS